jgi:hypothetical protein
MNEWSPEDGISVLYTQGMVAHVYYEGDRAVSLPTFGKVVTKVFPGHEERVEIRVGSDEGTPTLTLLLKR